MFFVGNIDSKEEKSISKNNFSKELFSILYEKTSPFELRINILLFDLSLVHLLIELLTPNLNFLVLNSKLAGEE